MPNIRKTHSTQAKVKIAVEAIKGSKTTAELTSAYGVHATQINNWKKAAFAASHGERMRRLVVRDSRRAVVLSESER
jgi:transposase-like protein